MKITLCTQVVHKGNNFYNLSSRSGERKLIARYENTINARHVRGISNAIFKGSALAQDSKYDPNINASNRKLLDAEEVP